MENREKGNRIHELETKLNDIKIEQAKLETKRKSLEHEIRQEIGERTEEKKSVRLETPYERIMRETPEGNWTDAAAQQLTDPDEIKQFIKEEIYETLRKDSPYQEYVVIQHTPESLVDSIRRVINGPNIKTPEKKAVWEKALQEAIDESDHFPH